MVVRICASGATGSIGKHLPAIFPFMSRLEEDSASIVGEFELLKPEIFIHLAALTNTNQAIEKRKLSHEINVIGAGKIMEAFAKSGGRRFIFASTSHIYGATNHGTLSSESDEPRPISVYARDKLLAEERLTKLAKAYQIELIIARIFSVFGPDMASHYLASKVYSKENTRIQNSDFPTIENGADIRDFLSPTEVAGHLNQIALSDPSPSKIEIVNVCSGVAISVEQKILEVVPNWPRSRIQSSNSKVPHLVGSTTKLSRLLKSMEM